MVGKRVAVEGTTAIVDDDDDDNDDVEVEGFLSVVLPLEEVDGGIMLGVLSGESDVSEGGGEERGGERGIEESGSGDRDMTRVGL